jgi:uncharacterized protein DUF6236
MADKVLYFPYIRVPNSEWFTQVLLYWDEVGSIVPYEYVEKPEKLGLHMRELVQFELVRQIFPGQHIHAIPYFTEAFLEFVDSPGFPVKPGSVNLDSVETSRIHIEKLDRIADELVKRRLARKRKRPWFDVESTVADQFMTYLASVLSQTNDLRSVPITDQERSLVNFSLPAAPTDDWRQELDRIRPIILQDLLPVPAGGIPPEELASFKSDHLQDLGEFRRKIESFLAEIVSLPDSRLADYRIELFKQQAQVDIDKLMEIMQTRGWRRVGLGSFLALSAAALSVADGITTGGTLTLTAAAFGLGSVVSDFVTPERLGSGPENYAAYAALARKQFGA